MKTLFLLLVFYIFSTNIHAQTAPVPANGKPVTSLQLITENEKQAYAPYFNQGSSGMEGNTVASGNFHVNYYRCEWTVDPNIRFIAGKVTSHFTILLSTNTITFDLSDTLTVDSVTYRGSQAVFSRPGNNGVTIQFPASIGTGQADSVSVYYHGVPRVASPVFYTPFTQTSHSGAPVIYTLAESYGAREWWPCRNGLDDKADSLDVIVTNPAVYQASTNGLMVRDSVIGGQRISYWKHRYPIASYLVGLAVTNYVVLKDSVTSNNVRVSYVNYAYPENQADFQASIPDMQSTFDLYAGFFGTYPFTKEKYGFTQWNSGGGMEHQTNSFVGSPSLSLIAHETAHQWFGDRITCGSWQDIWLNEGFAYYCQVLFNEHLDLSIHYLTLSNMCDYIGSIPNGSVSVDDTTTVGRIFSTRLTYQKGGYLLHMLRWKLGDSTFFRGVRRYLNDPALVGKFAHTADLQRNLELESGQSISSFLKEWFYGQGIPTNTVSWVQDSSNLAYVKINQVTSDPSVSFFEMPLPVEFKNSTHDTTLVFNHTRSGQTFLANPGFKADTVIYDPHFWILSTHVPTIKNSCSAVNAGDSLLPYYKIDWQQNTNNWITVNVTQTNTGANALAENIPMILHFSGAGRDTTITLSNIRYSSFVTINPGFKVDNSFIVAGSCFLANNYRITQTSSTGTINDIRIFPIPVSNTALSVSVKNPSFKTFNLELFTEEGKLVYKKSVTLPGMDEIITLPVQSLPKSTYILKLTNENNWLLTKKILKL